MYENVKRFLIHIVLLFGCADISFAQRDSIANKHLRLVSDTIRRGDFTYICDTIGSTRINLFNANNHSGRGEVAYKDGTQIPFERLLNDDIDAVVVTDELHRLMWNIVDEAFTLEQASSFGKWRLRTTLNISSTTGMITDVYFEYINISNYANIPIEVYRNIELRLKNEVRFELTEEGKRLNYCLLSWSQCPIGRENSGLAVPEDGEKLTLPDGKLGDAVGSLGGSVGLP